MDPRDAQNILDIAGLAGSALHKDVITVESILLSTDQQIEHMKDVRRRLKGTRTAVLYQYDEDGIDAEEFITTMGDALTPLAKTICRLEAKRDCLRMCLNQMNAVVRASNKFANKLPAIPKAE